VEEPVAHSCRILRRPPGTEGQLTSAYAGARSCGARLLRRRFSEFVKVIGLKI